MNDILLNKILEQYDIGALLRFEKILIGVSSDNYRVETSKGIYFLKKHRSGTRERIGSLEKIEQFFAANNIPVITPLPTTSGTLHTLHEDNCYVIYPFISGESFGLGKASDKVIVSMATMLAQMHLLTKDSVGEGYADVSMYFMPKKAQKVVAEIDTILKHIEQTDSKTDYDILAKQGLMLKRTILLANESRINTIVFGKYNIGHGDYHPSNLFFTEDFVISAIFDLDMSGPMPRIYELVRSIMLTCLNHDYSDEQIRQAKIFAKTYHALYPFTKQELAMGMEAFYFKTLSVWRERAHYYEANTRTDDEYKDTLYSINYLTEKRSELVDTLFSSIETVAG